MSRRIPFLGTKSLAWLVIVLVAALLVRYLPSRTAQPFLPNGWYEVDAVVDGDTLIIHGGSRVRLVSVDAPEMRHRNPPPEPFAEDAKKAVVEMMNASGWRVRLERCGPDKDRYGRFLRHVYVERGNGALMIEHELARRGLAVVKDYGGGCPHLGFLKQAEEEALEAGAGIWTPQPVPVN